MLKAIHHFATQDLSLMYTVLYRSPWFFFDIWSFNHFFSGMLIIFLARRCGSGVRARWTLLMALLLGWELLEILFLYISVHIFLPETIPDQFTDIVVGVLGALLVEGWYKWRSGSSPELAPIRAVDIA
jgi:hypothetical protein